MVFNFILTGCFIFEKNLWISVIFTASSILLRQHSSIRIGLSSPPCFRADSSCHSMLMEKPTPAMPPGRGRMVCKASLRGPCRMSPRLSRELPPSGRGDGHSIPLVTAPHSIALTLPHQEIRHWLQTVVRHGWDLSMGGGQRHPMQGDSPPMAVSGSMHGNRAPAPTELGVGTGTSSLCFDIFPAHDLKEHCPRAESDGDVLRKAAANMCCSFCLKYRYQEFFVWSHCLAKELHSC